MAQTLYHEWFVKFRFPGHEHTKMVDSELGLIPEGWEVKKLGNYIKTQKGFAFKSQWYQDSGVPLVKVSNFTEDSINTQNLICISEEIAQQYKKHKLDSNDIIIQTVGSWASNPKSVVGKVIRVPRQAQKSLLNQNAVKLIPEIPLNETFLYYLLKRNDFKNYIIGCAQGAASQASITLDSIREFKFLLPSIELLNSFYNLTYPIWELVNNLSIKNISLSQTRDLLLPKLISGEIDVEHLEITTEDIAA
ncbi:MAG: restriction endonuclease subunit S [Nostoc sp.]|uniref:restriction endonuclease subunit S n=1 Tax=Nostoc sp. TaxID=1180 RepID=UPI002FF79024